jgi:hypothetical protein
VVVVVPVVMGVEMEAEVVELIRPAVVLARRTAVMIVRLARQSM